MIDRGRHNLLGIRVNAVDMEAAVARVIGAARDGEPLATTALAVHGLMTGALDRTHRHRLNGLDLVVPDGQPVRWALNGLHHAQLPERVYGPHLMLNVCERAAEEGLPIYLFGGRASLLADLRRNLERRYPGIQFAGVTPSRFRSLSAEERDALADDIRASGAKILFIGLGCPRQEVFAYEMRSRVSMPMLAVGAAFNFIAGELAQAPPRLQRLGLEWAYRLAAEPRRLWKRYLLLNPLYVTLVACQAAGVYQIDPENSDPPQREICYG
jgi:N-acetylglucosaminyldiphosphoundecaprenol N-acetyl-beta-D-mannosaminyltransferase